MPISISVPDELERRGYVEIPSGEVVTVADLVSLLQQFDANMPVCGDSYSHNLSDLRMLAIEKQTVWEDGADFDAGVVQKVLYLKF